MFRTTVCGFVLALSAAFVSPTGASAEVIGSGRFTVTHLSGPNTDPSRRVLAFGLDTIQPTGSGYDNPRLFSNQSLSFSQSGGTVLVATAASDPFFNTWASRLTNGSSQSVIAVYQWSPTEFGFSNSAVAVAEPQFFGLPPGTSDFDGQTVRGLGLQINFFDEFDYTNPDTNQPAARYRFDATLLVSDTETIAAPQAPVAIALAARANAFRVTYGDTLLLDASKSIGDVAQYRWDLNRDGVYDISTTDPQTLLTADQYAPYLTAGASRSVLLSVTDTAGRTSMGASDSFTYVPEPSTTVMLAAAAGALALTRGRRRANGMSRRVTPTA